MIAQTLSQAVHAHLTKNPRSTVAQVTDALSANWSASSIRGAIADLVQVGALRSLPTESAGGRGRPVHVYIAKTNVSRKAATAAVTKLNSDRVKNLARRKILAANAAKARAALAAQRASAQGIKAKSTKSTKTVWNNIKLAGSTKTIRNQLVKQLSIQIKAGNLAAFTKPMKTTELAQKIGIGHATVGRAYKELADKGLFVKVRGRYQVAAKA